MVNNDPFDGPRWLSGQLAPLARWTPIAWAAARLPGKPPRAIKRVIINHPWYYVLRDDGDAIVEEPLDGVTVETASISRTDGQYTARFRDKYKTGGSVPVLTLERFGNCLPTELRSPE